MKSTVTFAIAMVFCVLNLCAQKRDSTAQKPKPVTAFNPNARRNGYENYQNSADASGVNLNPGATINTIDHRYEGLRGTPYFLPNWSQGQIEMTNGQNYPSALIKFDAFNQQIRLLRTWAGGDSIVVSGDRIKAFQLRTETGELFRFRHLENVKSDDGRVQDDFFLVLHEGKNALVKRITKRFKPADYKDPYGNNIRYDSFTNYNTYYLLKADTTLIKIKPTKKFLLDLFADQKTAIKAFIEKQNLNFGTDADAETSTITIVQYYNGL